MPAPPSRPWWDVALVAALVPTALIEGIVGDDVPWSLYTTLLTMACAIAVLWRAQHPLLMLLLAFGAQTQLKSDQPWPGWTTAPSTRLWLCCCFPPRSRAGTVADTSRWGSCSPLACHVLRELLDGSPATGILVGVGFLIFPVVLGVAVASG